MLLKFTKLYKQSPQENLVYFHYLPQIYFGFIWYEDKENE